MNTSSAEDEINPTENSDDALLDSLGASVKKLISKGKDRGYITVDELNNALPPENEQIEDVMAMISDMGINIVENEEESEEEAPSGSEDDDTGFKLDEVESSRTDDPVRMYLREMGAVELLSREGEIAIAKRIEAGRDLMIGGLCESALTIKALTGWHSALQSGKMLLRDIIDLDATYGSDSNEDGIPVSSLALDAALSDSEKEREDIEEERSSEQTEDEEEDAEEENGEEFEDSDDADSDDDEEDNGEDGDSDEDFDDEDGSYDDEEEDSSDDDGEEEEEDSAEDDSPAVSLAQMLSLIHI